MKQIFKNIISIISAIYFLFAGTGYNIINYCCDSCENIGIEYIAENSCSDAHQHNHDNACCSENHYDYTISDFQAHTKECNLLRLKVETPTVNSVSTNIENKSFNIHLYTAIEFIKVSVNHNFFSYHHYSPPEFNLLSSGRDILCHNSVLLI